MKLQNKTKNDLQHSSLDDKMHLEVVELKAGSIKDIPEKIAKVWLKIKGIVEYIEPAIAKAKENALLKEIEELKKENNKLKGESELDILKKEATKLGIKFAKNIGVKKLKEKIAEFKENK